MKTSAPITRTRSATQAAIMPAPAARAYRNPVQTAATSKAAAPRNPRRLATSGAVAGQGRSGVVVARDHRIDLSQPR